MTRLLNRDICEFGHTWRMIGVVLAVIDRKVLDR